MKKNTYRLFTAGPVNVSDLVKNSLIYSEIGHREPEFSVLLKNIREKLLEVFGVRSEDYSAVVFNGSGTAAIESILMSSTHPEKEILVIGNGFFGDRMAEICKLHGMKLIHLDCGWGNYPNLKEIEEIIARHKDLETVAMVFLETSTGMVNPIHEVGVLCKKYNKLFIVDAVSGLGGDPIDITEDNIDFCVSNTNKCLSGLPVLSFICAKKLAVEKIKDIKPKGFYLDFIKHYEYEENLNQTPYTPQIPLLYMLDKALDELLEEGIENRRKRYTENNLLLQERLEKMGFEFQIKNHISNVLTNVLIPKGYSFEEIHDKLKEKGFIVYPGKGPLEGKVIHIANIGILKKDDIIEFCNALESIKKELEEHA